MRSGWEAVLGSLTGDGWAAGITCREAPIQIEGRLPSGEPFYFRARHGEVSLAVGGGDPAGAPAWEGSTTWQRASYLPPAEGETLLRQLWQRFLDDAR